MEAKSDVTRIRFIKRPQTLGFTLKEILDLRSLRVDPRTTCRDVKRREKKSRGQIADMQEKIRDLQKMKKALMELTASCRGWGPTSECPILEMLASEDF